MEALSKVPVVTRPCFFSEAILTDRFLLVLYCDCASSLFPNRRYSSTRDTRMISASAFPATLFAVVKIWWALSLSGTGLCYIFCVLAYMHQSPGCSCISKLCLRVQ